MQPNETYATFLVSSQLCGPEVPTGALPHSTLQMKQWIKPPQIYYAVAVATAVAPAVMMPSLLPSLLPSLPLPLVQLSLAVL